MQNLYDVLADAQNGEAMAKLGREYGLSPQQTRAAVAALLPAISMGLKRSTATPEGLGDLFALMGTQPDLYAMYDDPRAAFSREGRSAGNAALARMFGSPDASRAIANQAQQLSGISSAILKKLLPVHRRDYHLRPDAQWIRKGRAICTPTLAGPGGGLIDILRQIFRQGAGADPVGHRAPFLPSPTFWARTQRRQPPRKPRPGPDQSLPIRRPTDPVPTDTGGQASPWRRHPRANHA